MSGITTAVKRFLLGEDNTRYRARVYYLWKGVNWIEIHFVITKDQEAHVKLVHKEYTARGATIGPILPVEFESDSILLELPPEEVMLESGWKIVPLLRPVITKQEVDSFSPGQCIPSCLLRAVWTKKSKPSVLLHEVTLSGAKELNNYFTIVLEPDSTPPDLHSKYPATLDSKPELSDLVATKIQSKWTDVGSQLGLDHGVGMRDYLKMLDVIGEISVLITSKAQTFHWKGYGLKLLVPPGALPPGMKQCELFIKVAIFGQFTLPKNTSLVSAVYWFHSEPQCEFSQPLALEIQHCATSSQTSRLSFAKCSHTSLPYNFDILEGDFSQAAYGRMQLHGFSLIAVLKGLPWLTWLFGPDDLKYHARVYYLKRENQREIHFVVTNDLETHATKVRQEYTGRGATIGPHMKVEFEASSISLQLPPKDETLGDGWKLQPLFPPVIFKKDVDSSGTMHEFPHCELTAMWTGQGTPSQLAHEVTLNGAKKPYDCFLIVLDVTPPDIWDPQQISQWENVNDTILEQNSLRGILRSISTTASQWFHLGVALGLSYGTLRAIECNHRGDAHRCLMEMMAAWLQMADDSRPSWRRLASALNSPVVNRIDIANTIAARHPSRQ